MKPLGWKARLPGQDWQLISAPCSTITTISLTSLTTAASLIATVFVTGVSGLSSTLTSFVVSVGTSSRCRHGGHDYQEQDKQESQLHRVDCRCKCVDYQVQVWSAADDRRIYTATTEAMTNRKQPAFVESSVTPSMGDAENGKTISNFPQESR